MNFILNSYFSFNYNFIFIIIYCNYNKFNKKLSTIPNLNECNSNKKIKYI